MRRAFSLVELLVVLGVIAVLIALLVPTLAGARDAGGSAVCLSNLRQIGVAFAIYDDVFDEFPKRPFPDWHSDYSWRFGVGGVHHYGTDQFGNPLYPEDVPLELLVGRRPLNEYVGRDTMNQARDAVWQCPNDDGVEQPAADDFDVIVEPWWDFNINDQDAGSVFAFTGSSYENNRFMYHAAYQDLTVRRYAIRDVAHPAMFVLCGDAGGVTIATYGGYNSAMIRGDWHGTLACQMATADGSARHFNIISGTDETGKSLPTTRNGYTFERD